LPPTAAMRPSAIATSPVKAAVPGAVDDAAAE
jgi:hypothetical protein